MMIHRERRLAVSRRPRAAVAVSQPAVGVKPSTLVSCLLVLALLVAATLAVAAEDGAKANGCEGFGPQTPRDIDQLGGSNPVEFTLAPEYDDLNLCNIHFHKNAEHKAKDFAIYAGKGDNGVGGGYQCAVSKQLSKAELKPVKESVCDGVQPGDTVEFHWVHSSCAVEPGPGLGSCLSDACANPDLRVETQVFTVVNDPDAMDLADFRYAGAANDAGLHQALALPSGTGKAVEFLGSTTGPSYTAKHCSPLQVSWSVRPHCAKLSIQSLAKWCESNVFEENKAHGVRELVTDPALLSEIE